MKPLCLALGLLAGLALQIPQALALDTGECGPMAEMTAKVKAEGQQSIVTGVATADRAATGAAGLRSFIFSTNTDGSVGYVLQTDNALQNGPTTMCVYSRMMKVRVYDPRKADIPDYFMMKTSEEGALKKCAELVSAKQVQSGTCGSFNTMTRLAAPSGDRIFLQGTRVRKSGSTFEADGFLVTATLNLNSTKEKGTGTIQLTMPEGSTIIDRVFIHGTLTDQGMKRFAAK